MKPRHDSPRAQTCTFDGPGLRKHHQRDKKSENGSGRGKKSAKFLALHPSGPHPSGPHPSGPHPSGPHPSGPHPSAPPFGAPPFGAHFSRLGLHPSGPHLWGFHPSGPKRVLVLLCSVFFFNKQENTETVKLAKVGLAKVGHPNFGQSRSNFLAKVGLVKVGLSRWSSCWWRSGRPPIHSQHHQDLLPFLPLRHK